MTFEKFLHTLSKAVGYAVYDLMAKLRHPIYQDNRDRTGKPHDQHSSSLIMPPFLFSLVLILLSISERQCQQLLDLFPLNWSHFVRLCLLFTPMNTTRFRLSKKPSTSDSAIAPCSSALRAAGVTNSDGNRRLSSIGDAALKLVLVMEGYDR